MSELVLALMLLCHGTDRECIPLTLPDGTSIALQYHQNFEDCRAVIGTISNAFAYIVTPDYVIVSKCQCQEVATEIDGKCVVLEGGQEL